MENLESLFESLSPDEDGFVPKNEILQWVPEALHDELAELLGNKSMVDLAGFSNACELLMRNRAESQDDPEDDASHTVRDDNEENTSYGSVEEEEEKKGKGTADLETIRALFNKMDVRGNQILRASDLVEAIPGTTPEDLELIISQLNPSTPGQVNFEEFYAGFDVFVEWAQSRSRDPTNVEEEKAQETKKSPKVTYSEDIASPPESGSNWMVSPQSEFASPNVSRYMSPERSEHSDAVSPLPKGRRVSQLPSRAAPGERRNTGVFTRVVREQERHERLSIVIRDPQTLNILKTPRLPRTARRTRFGRPKSPKAPAAAPIISENESNSSLLQLESAESSPAASPIQGTNAKQFVRQDSSKFFKKMKDIGENNNPRSPSNSPPPMSPPDGKRHTMRQMQKEEQLRQYRSRRRRSVAELEREVASVRNIGNDFGGSETNEEKLEGKLRENKVSQVGQEDEEIATLHAKYETTVEQLEIMNRKYRMLGRLGRTLEVENTKLSDQLASALGELEGRTNDCEDLTEQMDELKRNYDKVMDTLDELREKGLLQAKQHSGTIESLEIEQKTNQRLQLELAEAKQKLKDLQSAKSRETRASRVTKMAQTKLLREAMREKKRIQAIASGYEAEKKRSAEFQRKIFAMTLEMSRKDELLKSLDAELKNQKSKLSSTLALDMVSPALRNHTARRMLARVGTLKSRLQIKKGKKDEYFTSSPDLAQESDSRRATVSFSNINQLSTVADEGETLAGLAISTHDLSSISEKLDENKKKLEKKRKARDAKKTKEIMIDAKTLQKKIQEAKTEFEADWRTCLKSAYNCAVKMTETKDKEECSELAQKIVDLLQPRKLTIQPPPTAKSPSSRIVAKEEDGVREMVMSKKLRWPEVNLPRDLRAQIASLVEYINLVLGNEKVLVDAKLVPISPNTSDLIHKTIDGLILASLINLGAPDTIDFRALNTKHIHDDKFHPFLHLAAAGSEASTSQNDLKQLSRDRMMENLTLVVESAKAIGVQTAGIKNKHLLYSYKYPRKVTDFIWKILDAHASLNVTLNNYPSLVETDYLLSNSKSVFEAAEALEAASEYAPQQLLNKWCTLNYRKAYGLLKNFNKEKTAIFPSFTQAFEPKTIALLCLGSLSAKKDKDMVKMWETGIKSAKGNMEWSSLRSLLRESKALKAAALISQNIEAAAADTASRVPERKGKKHSSRSGHATDEWAEKARFAATAAILQEIGGFWTIPESKKEKKTSPKKSRTHEKWGGKRAGLLDDDKGSNRLERAFRMWINSVNARGVYIHNLFADCRDGLVLLRVLEKMSPGCVPTKSVERRPKKIFQKISNCNLVVSIGKDHFRFSLVGIGGENLARANKKLTLALVWQMMRFHLCEFLQSVFDKKFGKEDSPLRRDSVSSTGSRGRSGSIFSGPSVGGRSKRKKTVLDGGDAMIIDWANKSIAKATGLRGSPPVVQGTKWSDYLRIRSFKDDHLASSLYLFALLWAIDPYPVDWSLVTPGKTPKDQMLNARYAISVARKFGATIFLLPEDIMERNPKMIMTFIGSVLAIEFHHST
mmetsp:Transcript_18023/g.27010  ORF Transcript_18023/g.27010 Transcript_18023/m.27010 type:complete len:1546 (+) Transcript_18023:19-4656(+)